MDTPKELVEKYFDDWMQSDEARKLDFNNAGKLEVEERCTALAGAFMEYLMATFPDELWHLADTRDILYRAWDAAAEVFNNPSVYGDNNDENVFYLKNWR